MEELTRICLEWLYELGYKYLATDLYGSECIFKTKPKKQGDKWCDKDNSGMYLPINLWLSLWKDEEPKSITELLGINEVDWSQVPVDTKIIVSDDEKNWRKRYFAKYEGDIVYAWSNGCTSWNAEDVVYWNYAKLAEE